MSDVNNKKPPRPGTPEYDDFVEDQAQSALDRALAMPLVRIFFGSLFLVFAFGLAEMVINPLVERKRGEFAWQLLSFIVIGIPVLLGSAYVVLYGKSRALWMRDALRSYRPKQTKSPQTNDDDKYG